MAEVVVNTDPFMISARWKCKFQYHGSTNYGSWVFQFVETSESSVSFSFNIPSGATIQSAGIYANLTYPVSGISILTMNGINATPVDDKYFFPISDVGNGVYTAVFKFKPNGQISKDTSEHSATIAFSNVELHIVYEGEETPPPAIEPSVGLDNESVFNVPPQSVCFLSQETNAMYFFDGVVKIQHSFTSKIEEEPDKKKDEYINNARNEPDKLVLDVVMSDVYTDTSAMTDAGNWDDDRQRIVYDSAVGIYKIQEQEGVWSRSGNAVWNLHRLKEARTLFSVVTPQYVYLDMIIAGITINQDAENPYGWQGQIEFRHKYDTPEEKKNNYKPKNTDDDPPGTPSVFQSAMDWISGIKTALFGGG